MTVALIVCTVVAVLTSVGLVGWQVRAHSADGLLRDRLRERLLVTLKSGETFSGLLWEADGRTVVLRDAAQLVPGAEPVRADGEVILTRSDVSYMQRADLT